MEAVNWIDEHMKKLQEEDEKQLNTFRDDLKKTLFERAKIREKAHETLQSILEYMEREEVSLEKKYSKNVYEHSSERFFLVSFFGLGIPLEMRALSLSIF